MLLDLASLLLTASLASGVSIPRRDPDALYARQATGDPPFQSIPTTAKPDNTFSNGGPPVGGIDSTNEVPPDVYGNRTIDLPFGRLYHGNMKFFSAGQLNTPTGDTDQWLPKATDSASQSACGIPDNAFQISKVAIHPYFLKYADLSRYCMQDVCISFWNEDGSSDMMLKVTDICSTDPNDPTSCATPGDIKIDRTKAQLMEHLSSPPTGDVYPDHIWWFFMKCWDDGLVQPAYADNWFAQPALPCNLPWAQATQHQQWVNNNLSYPQQNPPWPTYPNGAYATERDDTTSPPITDFDPSATYSWTPVAGGKGWGNPSNTPNTGAANTNGATNTTNANGNITPKKAKAKIPSNSGQVPSNSGQVPSNSGQVPSNSGQVQSNNGQAPSNSGQVPSNSGQVPSTSGNLQSSTSNTSDEDECDDP